MIKHSLGIACTFGLLAAALAGCSSADTPDPGTSSGGSSAGTTSTGSGATGSGATGSGATGGDTTTGSGGSGAGTTSTGGTGAGGTGTAGTSSGTGGTGVNPAGCTGIKSNMACPVEGTDCPNLKCGVADSGTRSCQCATTWSCSSCDFTSSPYKDRPADIMTCTTEADKVPCTEEGKICEGAPGDEVCACYSDDEGELIWDCDARPSTWPA